MSVKIKAALIAGVVALVTSTISSFATFWQIQAAQSMQIMSLRNELIKPQFEQRLAAQASAYPNVLRVLKALSDSLDNLSPQKIRALADDLDNWIYSTVIMYADDRTLDAAIGLRNACRAWLAHSDLREITRWRDVLLKSIRETFEELGFHTEIRNLLEEQPNQFKNIETELNLGKRLSSHE
jgi:hypothetical protein